MFVGAVPKPVIEQIVRVIDFQSWGDVFVGCSGSFRFDKAVKAAYPSVRVHSNDVSLLTCCLGSLARGESFRIHFNERLQFIEEQLPSDSFMDRVAAVLVALQMGTYSGKNDFNQAHFAYYENDFPRFLELAKEKLVTYMLGIGIESFYAGDFQDQVERCLKVGGGVVAFPPTYKGGYEQLYKFINTNVEWDPPEYGIWDPKNIEDWTLGLAEQGVRHCILSDQLFEKIAPITTYYGATNKPIYCYANEGDYSLRRDRHKIEPFKYKAVDSSLLHAGSKIQIVNADAAMMNFLKDKYLAKGIMHSSGMLNFLLFVDGMLVGGFIYSKSKFGSQDTLYLLSDFSISRERKLSKLVAMMATSEFTVNIARKKYVLPIKQLATTAFTKNAVSMKYRGIFELLTRKPGMLNYGSKVRKDSPAKIYRTWFKKYA